MIVKLRIQCSTRAMPIPDPEHAIGIHDRGTGMTGARVRNAWRHRRNRLLDSSRER